MSSTASRLSPARSRLRALLTLIVAVVLTTGLAVLGTPERPAHADNGAVQVTTLRVPVGAEPDGQAVSLDVAIYDPATTNTGGHPAVLLAHGFGGSRADLDEQARDLAADGLVVLTWTARGFGESGGRIHLNDPDFEVADAKALIDVVASRPEVATDRPGDPRIAVVGGSYGGALALMLAAADDRIDAVAGLYTWHDLATALFPNQAVLPGQAARPGQDADLPGPFQQQWISRFFLSTVAQGARAEPPAPPPCGRFDPAVCRQLLGAAETGHPSDELLQLLHRHSPARELSQLAAPTLLVQGMRDRLFGLDQADATAAALLGQGTEVTVRWSDGGHDGAASDPEAATDLVRRWLHDRLDVGATDGGTGEAPAADSVPKFSWVGPEAFGSDAAAPTYTSDRYPGTDPDVVTVPLKPGSGDTVLTPPGGQPASITATPGGGAAGQQFSSYPLAALPGQSVAFDTEPIATDVAVVGAPTVRLRVTSTGSEVTLFVTLWQVNDTSAAQPRQLVAPVRLRVQPNQPTEVTVRLPMATWQLDRGTTWRVLVASTDSSYSNPTAARADRIELAAPTLEVPTVTAIRTGTTSVVGTEAIGLLIALGVVAAAVVGWSLSRRRSNRRVDAPPVTVGGAGVDDQPVPLLVDGLTKSYPDGHRAVSEVSWQAGRGQVVGLLGPNGAGKTTTLRMVLGLIRPDSGRVLVNGSPVRSGAAVLSGIGALVEGPGFLPHLTGRQNLHAYWDATGRPQADASFDEALEVAALGGAIDRPVRSYSQGMRQRLGIAQAMLGRPDVLILDEPTNGLDPPQIAAMRPILQAYAESGRTVVVSSHLLSEVEQTCTHVVVMDGGRVISTGAVDELLDGQRHLEELFLDLIAGSGVHDDPGHSVADRLRQVRPR